MTTCVNGKTQTSFDKDHSFFSFPEIFGNDHPVEVEIGCGKGIFLGSLARQFPEINFVGVDRGERWMWRGRLYQPVDTLRNLKFLKFYAWEFLERYLAEESTDCFHIYFPDPWPKRRHWKRRLVGADFLRLLHSRLKPEGLVQIATDDFPYFTQIREAISATDPCWGSMRESVNKRLVYETVKTHYELKYENRGKSIYYLELQKR